ncbi:MAG: hypothetical protein ABFS23_14130, partial [Pseudomonadota bacterium]
MPPRGQMRYHDRMVFNQAGRAWRFRPSPYSPARDAQMLAHRGYWRPHGSRAGTGAPPFTAM